MDSDILKSIAAFLVTAACIIGPTIAEGLKRRMKAKMDAAPKVRQPRPVVRNTQQTPAPQRINTPHEAMMRAAEHEAPVVKPAAATPHSPAAAGPNVPTEAVPDRIAALRRAVIAAEVLRRRF